MPISWSRTTPVTLMVASLTSVILPSGLMVTSGIEARLDQAAGVLRGLLLRGDVARGGEDAEHVAAASLYTEAL